LYFLFITTARIQTYVVTVVIAVLVGVGTLIMINIGPIAFASPLSATTNQTGNQTGANITTSVGSVGDQSTATKQLDQAMKALESGDNAAAEGYMKEADKTISEGQAKTHLSEAMKALQADDIEGAKTHTQFARDNL
jgi:cellobiose-specific phosphotransferase system component IIA